MNETLYLIDGFAQIFRAYYAIRGGMRSPNTGEPTQALYGFAAMLLKVYSQLRPDYLVVVVDAPGRTFRDDLFADYKATRNATPDDLIVQIPRILEMLERFGIPVLSVPGYEADDIIASVVTRITSDPQLAHVNVRIVSKDKDLEQLLGDRVCMYDVHTDMLTDSAALHEHKGIRPDQVIDLLTLCGDTVDNVPGVPGIGPKTAAALIQEFGSLDGIYANIDRVKGKKRESLEGAQSGIALSRALVTLSRDCAFDFTLSATRAVPPDPNRVIPFFQQLGFNRFQEDVKRLAATVQLGTESVPAGEAAAQVEVVSLGSSVENSSGQLSFDEQPTPPVSVRSTAADGEYRAVVTAADLAALCATLRAQSIICVDTETTGLERSAKLCGISLAWEAGKGVYVPVRSPDPVQHLTEADVLDALRPILEDETIRKCGHGLKFDARMFLRSGIRLRGVVFDSFLASSLLEPNRPAHKLDYLALALLGHQMIPIADLIGEGSQQASMETVPIERIVPYAAEDADVALRLYHLLAPQIEATGMTVLLGTGEAPLTAVIAQMEHNGILCDPDELIRQGEALAGRVAELRLEVMAKAGQEFGIDSPKQLATVLFDVLKLKPGKKTQSGYSTDVNELERLAALEDPADPRTSVPRLIIEYRQLAKLISTYLGNLRECIDPQTKRIHSTFHQIYTATGRLASQSPNLQNIPVRTNVGRQIRKAFHAPEHHVLLCADYSQIELRILAHFSQDPGLLAAFANDEDIHASVASQVFGVPIGEVTGQQRSQAKVINFGIIYGVTAFGLSRRIEQLDTSAAARLIDDYRIKFPGVTAFLDSCVRQALEHGYVATIMGRRRAVPEINSNNRRERSFGERIAINSVIQGSAADLIKLAMVNVQRRIDRDNLDMKLLLQIHDELVLETPEALAVEHSRIVREEMEGAMTLRVPLRCSVGFGRNWLDAK